MQIIKSVLFCFVFYIVALYKGTVTKWSIKIIVYSAYFYIRD